MNSLPRAVKISSRKPVFSLVEFVPAVVFADMIAYLVYHFHSFKKNQMHPQGMAMNK